MSQQYARHSNLEIVVGQNVVSHLHTQFGYPRTKSGKMTVTTR